MDAFDLISGEENHEGPKVWRFVADRDMTLKEAQKMVGGYVEPIPIDIPGYMMLADEDGRLKGLALNAQASESARQPVCGNVVLVQHGKFK